MNKKKASEVGTNSNASANAKAAPATFSLVKILVPLLIGAALLAGYFFMNSSNTIETDRTLNTAEQIEQLFASNEVKFKDKTGTSGSGPDEQARVAAIDLFAEKEYKKAGETFAQIERTKKTTQDHYYQSYSELRSGQSMDAVMGFGKVLVATKKGDTHHKEAQLYQVLSFIALKDYTKAKSSYSKLEAGSWAQKRLANIIASLDPK